MGSANLWGRAGHDEKSGKNEVYLTCNFFAIFFRLRNKTSLLGILASVFFVKLNFLKKKNM